MRSTIKAMNFRQFLLMSFNDSKIGTFAKQATSDRNWAGNSAQSLRNHLRAINAPPESMDSLTEAEASWSKIREASR